MSPIDYPHVTDVLSSVGMIDTTWMTEAGRVRGTAVHLACQYEAEGDLDPASIDPLIAPYLASYKLFRHESLTMPQVVCVEEVFVNDQYGYQGRVDIVSEDRSCVMDIKTGTTQPATAIQLAAYALHFGAWRRIAVRLRRDGTYRLDSYRADEIRRDLSLFLAALSVHNWKLANGLIVTRKREEYEQPIDRTA